MNDAPRMPVELSSLLGAGGTMGALIDSKDWAATPIGPAVSWPQSLRTALSVCLESRFPMILWWGPELAVLYNDAYIPIFGDKHPAVLGTPGIEAWGEVWDVIGPRLHAVLEGGRASWSDDELLLLNRYGFEEESYFTYAYSPIRVESGRVGGVFTAVTETTSKVVSARRLAVLRDMGALSTTATGTVEEICAAAAAAMVSDGHDVPFAAVYLLEGGEGPRAASAGALPEALAPSATAEGAGSRPWTVPIPASGEGRAYLDEHGQPCRPEDVGAGRAGAVVLRAGPAAGAANAVLVAGMSPRRRLDQAHLDFLGLAAGHLSNAIADVRAYESERRRAAALEELDRAKTSFFENVSHEFRTPLTLILGPLDVLARQERSMTADGLAQLALARANAERLARLVNALLDFSRLSAGGLAGTFRPTDLAERTADLASTFRAAIEAAGLRLEVDCPPLASPVYVDAGMWETIVLNLVSNAFKFTLAGSVTVALAADGDHAVLSVSDTGEGIPAGDQAQMFSRFHRVRGAKARTQEGSGIGLAMVAELVHLHRGTVEVDSAEGVGSTFAVRVPLGRDHLAGAEVDEAPAEAVRTQPGPLVRQALSWLGEPGQPERRGAGDDAEADVATRSPRSWVLVADDNADMRSYLRRVLGPHFDVETVGDGEEALRAATERRPDLVLTDVMMPGLDGLGLVAALRANPATASLPVIVLSARAGEEASVEGLSVGADDYLMKPFSASELVSRVQARLDQARARADEVRRRQEASDRFFDLSLDLMAIAGFDGRVRRANPAYERLLGWTNQEMMDMAYIDIIHPDDRADFYNRLEDFVAGRETVTYELRVMAKDGGYRWIRASAKPVPEEGVMYVFGLDITARKTAEGLVALDADVLDHIARREPLAAVLDLLARRVEGLAPGMLASVLLVDESGSRLRRGAAPSLPETYNAALDDIPIGPGVGACGTAAHRRVPVVVADIASDPLWADFADVAAAHDLAACWSAPICGAGEEVLGVFALYDRRPRTPTPSELDLISTATKLARVAVEHARAEADLTEGRAQLAHAQAMAHLGSWQLEVATGMMTWSDEMFRLLGLAPGDVQPSAQELTARLPTAERAGTEAAIAAAVSRRRPASFDHRITGADGREIVAHTTIGVVTDDGGSVLRVQGTIQDVTELKSAQEALHEKEALYRQEREIAQALQRSLLPHADMNQPGLAVAARYLPGAEGMEVGGDWYDVFALDNGAVAFAIGDIVGRGLSAAATMGQLRTALRAYALVDPSPSAVIGRLNALVERLGRAEMATLVYGVYDQATRQATLACAGHPPPLVIGADGEPAFIDGGRWAPLGVGVAAGDEVVVSLTDGRRLLLYTDGLVERRNQSLDEGMAALRVAAGLAAGGPDDMCDRVIAAMLGPSDVDDDVAVLVLSPSPLAREGFRIASPAEPKLLRSLRRVLSGWLDELGVTTDVRDDVVLACNEAVSNAVEHAYGPEGGQVEIEARSADGTLSITVRDFGYWHGVRDRGGGRGLPIMSSLMDSVTVTPRDPGTEVRLGRAIGASIHEASVLVPDLVAVPGSGRDEDAVAVVALPAEVDLANAAAVVAALGGALGNDTLGLVVDLSATSYLDSSGLRALFDLALRMRTRRQHLRLVVVPSSPLARLLALTDAEGLFTLAPTVSDAAQEVRSIAHR